MHLCSGVLTRTCPSAGVDLGRQEGTCPGVDRNLVQGTFAGARQGLKGPRVGGPSIDRDL